MPPSLHANEDELLASASHLPADWLVTGLNCTWLIAPRPELESSRVCRPSSLELFCILTFKNMLIYTNLSIINFRSFVCLYFCISMNDYLLRTSVYFSYIIHQVEVFVEDISLPDSLMDCNSSYFSVLYQQIFAIFSISKLSICFTYCRFWTARARMHRVCYRCLRTARARVRRRMWRAHCSGASRAASRVRPSCRSSSRRALAVRSARDRVRGSSLCAFSCSTASSATALLRRRLRLAIRGILYI